MQTLEEAVTSYQWAVTPEAAAYIEGRGIRPETARTFRVGVVADPIPAHEPMRGGIAIPYLLRGKPLTVRSRNISGHGPKYMQPSGEALRVFNVDAIHDAHDEIHVAEGEFDAMILNQCGLPAIAFPGANTFRGHHGRMLAGFNKVFVWGDPDAAGAEFTTKILNRLPRSGRSVNLRHGDVTDTYLDGGEAAIHELWEAAS
jgi:DNA primase